MNPSIRHKRAISLFVVAFTLAFFGLSSSMQAVTPAPDGGYDTTAKTSSQPRALTFAERVAFERAIEEVYWRHRIWPKERPDPKPSLDAVMSQAQLEKKVEEYLRNSQALEDYWQRPITAQQLEAEIQRMAQHTKQPEVLHELFEALGNDPFVIAECLARPALAEADLQASNYTPPTISNEVSGCADNWTATTEINVPSARFLHTAVWTGSEMIVWGGNGVGDIHLNTGGRYNPSTDHWTATSTMNAPSPRQWHTAVWTGSEMIVWGGDGGGNDLNTGGRYDPGTDTWEPTSTTNAPAGRQAYTAVWTGSEMIVWGGFVLDPANIPHFFNTGGRYNPSTNSWTATSTTNTPSERAYHTAVWTGSEMIVWGGSDTNALNTGGRYNPSTNSWTATSSINAPIGRLSHTAVWTGSEMIIWGGSDFYLYPRFNTGATYNPNTDSWTATSTTNAPAGRIEHTAVWTGSEMIVWGGNDVNATSLNTGGRYNPSTDTWMATSTTNAPSPRSLPTVVWTGTEMIAWGGLSDNSPFYLNTGGRYCAPSGTVSYDFSGDGHPDYVLYNASTHQTAIWYLNNSVYLIGRYGPTLPPNWALVDVADFNGDGHPDYVLRNPITRQTAIWYLNNNVYVVGVYGPTPPSGWQLVATTDFNGDGHPDYVLYNAAMRQTAIWYLNNNVYVIGVYGPTLPAGWSLVGLADFNGDGKADYLLFNSTTRQSAIWYLNNNVYLSGVYGPTLPSGWQLMGAAGYNGDGHPDYALFNATTNQTAIWYLNNNVYVSGTYGPTLPFGWSLVAP